MRLFACDKAFLVVAIYQHNYRTWCNDTLFIDVFLTVHHSIDFSKYQLNAQFFILQQYIYITLRSSTCFEQHAAHHQEDQLYHHSLWYPHPL